MELNSEFWNEKYRTRETGWDIGYASPALVKYFDQIENPDISILIPGAGNAYEAEYLWGKGFSNLHVLDVSLEATSRFRERVPNFPEDQIHCQDFFEHKGSYDLIIEQTFFCALDPSLRVAYVQKMHSLLKARSKLVGLLFDIDFNRSGPPFGGSQKEYRRLFSRLFKIKILEPSYNSIKARLGTEVFCIFEK